MMATEQKYFSREPRSRIREWESGWDNTAKKGLWKGERTVRQTQSLENFIMTGGQG